MKKNTLRISILCLFLLTLTNCSKDSKDIKASPETTGSSQQNLLALKDSGLTGTWFFECRKFTTPDDVDKIFESTSSYTVTLSVENDGSYTFISTVFKDSACKEKYTREDQIAWIVNARAEEIQKKGISESNENIKKLLSELYQKGDSPELKTVLGEQVYSTEKSTRDQTIVALDEEINPPQTGKFIVGSKLSNGSTSIDIIHNKTKLDEAYTGYQAFIIENSKLYFSDEVCLPSEVDTKNPDATCKVAKGHTPEARNTEIDRTMYFIKK